MYIKYNQETKETTHDKSQEIKLAKAVVGKDFQYDAAILSDIFLNGFKGNSWWQNDKLFMKAVWNKRIEYLNQLKESFSKDFNDDWLSAALEKVVYHSSFSEENIKLLKQIDQSILSIKNKKIVKCDDDMSFGFSNYNSALSFMDIAQGNEREHNELKIRQKNTAGERELRQSIKTYKKDEMGEFYNLDGPDTDCNIVTTKQDGKVSKLLYVCDRSSVIHHLDTSKEFVSLGGFSKAEFAGKSNNEILFNYLEQSSNRMKDIEKIVER